MEEHSQQKEENMSSLYLKNFIILFQHYMIVKSLQNHGFHAKKIPI